MKNTLYYLTCLAMTTILLASPADALAGKKSSSRGKSLSKYDWEFDYELYAQMPESEKERWFIDTGNTKDGPERRYMGPYTLKEATKVLILNGDIPIVADERPFGNRLRPNLVTWVHVVTCDTFAELEELIALAKSLGLKTTYRVIPEE